MGRLETHCVRNGEALFHRRIMAKFVWLCVVLDALHQLVSCPSVHQTKKRRITQAAEAWGAITGNSSNGVPYKGLSLRTEMKLAEIGLNFADTKKGIRKTSGQFISLYILLFLQNSGPYFTTIIPYKSLYGTPLLEFPVIAPHASASCVMRLLLCLV